MDGWQTVIQIALMAAGSLIATRGLVQEWDGFRRPIRDPAKVLTFLMGFRMSVIGLALVGISAGWTWDVTWLLVLSLVIGGAETLESTVHIFAVTRGKDLRLGPAGREHPPDETPTGKAATGR